MSDDNTVAWPAYRVGNPDYIHALGAISSIFNKLEFSFRKLFPLYVRLPLSAAYQLFAESTNERRLNLMRECVDYSNHPDTIKDDVRYFIACYKTCADNRNVLLHSTVYFIFGSRKVSLPYFRIMAPIVPVQCWLARTALGWSVHHLSREAGVAWDS